MRPRPRPRPRPISTTFCATESNQWKPWLGHISWHSRHAAVPYLECVDICEWSRFVIFYLFHVLCSPVSPETPHHHGHGSVEPGTMPSSAGEPVRAEESVFHRVENLGYSESREGIPSTPLKWMSKTGTELLMILVTLTQQAMFWRHPQWATPGDKVSLMKNITVGGIWGGLTYCSSSGLNATSFECVC